MCLGDFTFLPGRRSLRSNSSSRVCSRTSGQVKGLSRPGTPVAAVGRQRFPAAVPGPGLSLCPIPVSSLLGEKGKRPRGARGWSWNLLLVPAHWSLTSNWSALTSAPSPSLSELPPPRLHDVHAAAYPPAAVEEVSAVPGEAACGQACLTAACSILFTDPLPSQRGER